MIAAICGAALDAVVLALHATLGALSDAPGPAALHYVIKAGVVVQGFSSTRCGRSPVPLHRLGQGHPKACRPVPDPRAAPRSVDPHSPRPWPRSPPEVLAELRSTRLSASVFQRRFSLAFLSRSSRRGFSASRSCWPCSVSVVLSVPVASLRSSLSQCRCLFRLLRRICARSARYFFSLSFRPSVAFAAVAVRSMATCPSHPFPHERASSTIGRCVGHGQRCGLPVVC